MTYAEKLKDPRWQKKRLEILNRDEFCCQSCYDSESTLHVHHRTYFRDKEPWEIPSEYLVTLCESCHGAEKDGTGYHDLPLVLKYRGFLEYDAEVLSGAFLDHKIYYPPSVAASIIAYAISDEAVAKQISDMYFHSLRATKK